MNNINDRVLFIKLGSLGDVLQLTPAIRVLKNNYPETEIAFLTSGSCKGILENNLWLSNIYSVDELGATKKPVVELIRISRLIGLLLRIRNKYDKVVIFHRSTFLNLILRTVLGNRIYSFSSGANPPLKGKEEFNLSRHRIVRNIDLLKRAYPELDCNISELKLEYYADSPFTLDVIKPYIVIAPGGGRNAWSEMPSRRWPLENYLALAKRISAGGKQSVVFVGGPEEKEIAESIEDNNADAKYCSLVGKTGIKQIAGILKGASLFIGNDSFPFFLAAAVGAKTLGLFGPTNSAVINPLGEHNYFIQSRENCSPCYNPIEGVKGAAYSCLRPICMEEITVGQVFDRVKEILNNENPASK